jgi:hypothetical protein
MTKINNGWIKLHRNLKDWGWRSDANTFNVFINLLLEANFTPNTWKGIKVQPGQLIFGRKEFSKKIGVSEQSIRTALKHLKSTNEITIKSTNKYSLISINNWETYQSINQLTNQQLTSNQPATNHTIRNKEYKNIKRESKLTYLLNIPQNDLEQITNDFELTVKQLQAKGETLHSYCLAHGKKYKNYRAFLLKAIRKDFKKRPERVKPVVQKEFTPDELAANREAIAKIKSNFRLGVI